MSQLRQRVLTAVALVPVILIGLFALPPAGAALAMGVVLLLAAWEWAPFAGLQSRGQRIGFTALLGAGLALAATLTPDPVPLGAVLWLALGWWAVAFALILRYPAPVPRAVAGIGAFLTLVPAWLAFAALLRVPERGAAFALLALGVACAADIGGYFAGRRFGRVRLAPSVSPGKTWEGVVGGLLLAGLVAVAGALLLRLPPVQAWFIGTATAAISVVGDLLESMLKRSVGVKDSSQLIPGHGGVLDRLDSVTAALPLFALGLTWLGVPMA